MPMQPADRRRRVDQKIRKPGIGEQAMVRDRYGETAAAQNVREKTIGATAARGPAAAVEENDEAAFARGLQRPVEVETLAGMWAIGDIAQQFGRPNRHPG